MEDLWELPLPVDTHIVKITNRLYDRAFSSVPSNAEKKDIHELWSAFCDAHDVTAAELDDALWRLAESGNWERHGKRYLDRLC